MHYVFQKLFFRGAKKTCIAFNLQLIWFWMWESERKREQHNTYINTCSPRMSRQKTLSKDLTIFNIKIQLFNKTKLQMQILIKQSTGQVPLYAHVIHPHDVLSCSINGNSILSLWFRYFTKLCDSSKQGWFWICHPSRFSLVWIVPTILYFCAICHFLTLIPPIKCIHFSTILGSLNQHYTLYTYYRKGSIWHIEMQHEASIKIIQYNVYHMHQKWHKIGSHNLSQKYSWNKKSSGLVCVSEEMNRIHKHSTA